MAVNDDGIASPDVVTSTLDVSGVWAKVNVVGMSALLVSEVGVALEVAGFSVADDNVDTTYAVAIVLIFGAFELAVVSNVSVDTVGIGIGRVVVAVSSKFWARPLLTMPVMSPPAAPGLKT